MYCGTVECLLPGCYTLSVIGELNGYVNTLNLAITVMDVQIFRRGLWIKFFYIILYGVNDVECLEGEESISGNGSDVSSFTLTYDDGSTYICI